MKSMAALPSILKKHYTHSRRKVGMLTFLLWGVHTLTQACTHVFAHAHTHSETEKTHTTQHIVFLLSHISHLNSGDVISNNYRWPLPVPSDCCL